LQQLEDVPTRGREDAVLLTSEMVSTPKHPAVPPGGRVDVRAVRHGDVLRIEVVNRRKPWGIGSNVERPGWDLRHGEPVAPSGWGLQLVDRVAARWGTVHETGRTMVWFEVELEPPNDEMPERGPRG
jgi:hypothetical protein